MVLKKKLKQQTSQNYCVCSWTGFPQLNPLMILSGLPILRTFLFLCLSGGQLLRSPASLLFGLPLPCILSLTVSSAKTLPSTLLGLLHFQCHSFFLSCQESSFSPPVAKLFNLTGLCLKSCQSISYARPFGTLPRSCQLLPCAQWTALTNIILNCRYCKIRKSE